MNPIESINMAKKLMGEKARVPQKTSMLKSACFPEFVEVKLVHSFA